MPFSDSRRKAQDQWGATSTSSLRHTRPETVDRIRQLLSAHGPEGYNAKTRQAIPGVDKNNPADQVMAGIEGKMKGGHNAKVDVTAADRMTSATKAFNNYKKTLLSLQKSVRTMNPASPAYHAGRGKWSTHSTTNNTPAYKKR